MDCIQIINDYGKTLFYKNSKIYLLIENLFINQKIKFKNISIILSNKKLLNKLKKDYFKLDQFTDVIAFNLEEENELIDGEIYISIDDVLLNASKYKVEFDLEFKRILIHGLLHLMGYDDSTKEEKIIMTNLENKYIKQNNKTVISLQK